MRGIDYGSRPECTPVMTPEAVQYYKVYCLNEFVFVRQRKKWETENSNAIDK